MQIRGQWRFAAACFVLAAAAAASAAAQAKAPATWRLAPDGFGPFKVGMRFAQVRRLAPRLRPTEASLLVSEGCDYLPLPGHPGVSLMFIDGSLRRIGLSMPHLRTTRGVGPGDPVSRVRRAYPGLIAEERAYVESEQTLTWHSGPNAIRFETMHGRIDEVYAGRWAEVQLIEGCS
jgi:hypothetical protein